MIKIQEGREFLDALNDIAMKERPTVAGDVDREKELFITKIKSEQKLSEKRADGDAPTAGVIEAGLFISTWNADEI